MRCYQPIADISIASKKFEVLYEQFGRDTRRVVEYFKTIRATGDRAALQSFLE